MTLAGFARLAGDGLRVVASGGAPGPWAPGGSGVPQGLDVAGAADAPEGLGVPELVAEAALLQARLDWFQTQLARLGDRGSGGAGQG
jgi:hypothetical protein